MNDSPEKVLWRGRPSFWNWWPSVVTTWLLVALALVLEWKGVPKAVPGLLAAAGALYAAVALRRLRHGYTLTTQRAIARSGLLSRRVAEVELREIRGVRLRQGLFQRLIGVGDIEFVTTLDGMASLAWTGIADPDGAKAKVREARLAMGEGDAR